MDKIKGVIFDMDGLMIDTEKYYNYYMCKAANELGFPMKKEHALLLRSLDNRFSGTLMQEYLGKDYDHQKVRELYHVYIEDYFAENDIEVKPGLFEILNYLKGKNCKICVATATRKSRALSFLKRIGAEPYVAYICSGYDLENSKPAPDIYLYTADQMGLLPEECVALEDSPNGVRAAYAAGCKTIMVPDLTQPEEEIQKMIYAKADTLHEVIGILEKLLPQE